MLKRFGLFFISFVLLISTSTTAVLAEETSDGIVPAITSDAMVTKETKTENTVAWESENIELPETTNEEDPDSEDTELPQVQNTDNAEAESIEISEDTEELSLQEEQEPVSDILLFDVNSAFESVVLTIRVPFDGSETTFEGVEIERRSDSLTWKTIKTVPITEFWGSNDSYLNYQNDELLESGQYQYRCRAYAEGRYGEYSPVRIVYYLQKPEITNIKGTGKKYTFQWAGDPFATSYQVKVKGNVVIEKKEIEGSVNSYTFKLKDYIEAGTKISFWVTAANQNTGSWQNITSIIVMGEPQLKGSLKTTADRVCLTWNKVKGAEGYELYRFNTSAKKYELIRNFTDPDTTTYTDSEKQPGTKYTYRLRAYQKLDDYTLYTQYSEKEVFTPLQSSLIKKVKQAVKNGKKPKQKTQKIKVNFPISENGQLDNNWKSPSGISDFFDYKGYYTIAFEHNNGKEISLYRLNTSNLKTVKKLKIKKKYSRVGGVTTDKEGNYYIAWGNSDAGEKGNAITFAVSKYNYNGKHVKTVKAKGKSLRVKKPFYGGNCAMVINGNVLVCSFARLMYKSNDGLNHQASQTFAVNTKTMKKIEAPYNYTSHSFDQRVISLKNGGFLFADLGDGCGRGMNINDGNIDTIPFHFYGDTGQNYTNAELGNIMEVSTGYALVGSSSPSLKTLNKPKQLFLQIIDPETGKSILKASTRRGTSGGNQVTDKGVKWLTNYKSGSFAANVQAVKTDDDRIVILWQKVTKNYKTTTYIMVVSPNGTILQPATKLGNVELNGNEELKYKDGYIYWSTAKAKRKKTKYGYYEMTNKSIITVKKLNVTPGMGVVKVN